jgi:hypothetical protein
MDARQDLIEIVTRAIDEHGAYALTDDENETLVEGVVDAIIANGWPRKDYEHEAERQAKLDEFEALRRQMADRGYRLVDSLDDDAPAGAGDSVEAYRG